MSAQDFKTVMPKKKNKKKESAVTPLPYNKDEKVSWVFCDPKQIDKQTLFETTTMNTLMNNIKNRCYANGVRIITLDLDFDTSASKVEIAVMIDLEYEPGVVPAVDHHGENTKTAMVAGHNAAKRTFFIKNTCPEYYDFVREIIKK